MFCVVTVNTDINQHELLGEVMYSPRGLYLQYYRVRAVCFSSSKLLSIQSFLRIT